MSKRNVFKNTNLFIYFSIQITRNKAIGFWEDVCSSMVDKDFRRYFHMNTTTLKSLCQFLKPKRRIYQGGKKEIAPAKAVAMNLAFLKSQLPCKQMSGFFGVSESAFIHTTEYIMQLMQSKSPLVIKWPEKKDYPEISADFNNKRFRCFPNVLVVLMGATSELLQKRMREDLIITINISTVCICKQFVLMTGNLQIYLLGKLIINEINTEQQLVKIEQIYKS